MRTLIVCDLDGTLSDCKHRQHLAAQKDWEGFHELMHLDPPIKHVLDFLKLHTAAGGGLMFLTGRPEEYRDATVKWLSEACDLDESDDYLQLVMRPKDDWRTDSILKPALLDAIILGNAPCDNKSVYEFLVEEAVISATDKIPEDMSWGQYLKDIAPDFLPETLLFLDDREYVVEAWRNLGYTCWQPAVGAF